MTSEYLHQYFEKNPMFDYTPIVSGYIKSIEQLLHAVCTSYRNSNNTQLDMSRFTLGSYIKYLEENTTIFRIDLQSELETIIDCLNRYRVESRNHLFHKDYFNDWDRAEMIRENTVALYIILLGAVDYHLLQRDSRTLGVFDDKYDHLFQILDTDDAHYYTVIVNGKEYTGLHKVSRSEGVLYDKYGIIKNTIQFTKFDYDHNVNVEISRRKMPTEIWITDAFGKREKRIW